MADSAAEARIDQALVTRIRLNGDRRAFEQLVRRHQGMVRAQLRRLLRGDEAAADDLAQETFVLAWRKLDQFRGDARFSTWLYRIAYTCFLQARRIPAQHDGVDDEAMEQLQAPTRAMDLQLDLQRAMQRLSAAEQAVLLHCVQLGLSHEEASYVLAMPLGTVKTHATRGKAKLKTWLADWRDASTEEAS
ncbi:RNA polymerase sigma factor [Dyella psychrodurans]|uniref:RNA polymerase sigma factor n=1 Tax=Dyella psychrodurans TaxID=1927960 RepID=UPI0013145FBF|nr:sigma-70 family RNA polymerase sigma factor [Dyella psychrodurans]